MVLLAAVFPPLDRAANRAEYSGYVGALDSRAAAGTTPGCRRLSPHRLQAEILAVVRRVFQVVFQQVSARSYVEHAGCSFDDLVEVGYRRRVEVVDAVAVDVEFEDVAPGKAVDSAIGAAGQVDDSGTPISGVPGERICQRRTTWRCSTSKAKSSPLLTEP